MRILHVIQRFPPALGGSESYFARLSRYLTGRGHRVIVWTSNARDLEAFWSPKGRCLPPGEFVDDGVRVRRFPLWRMTGRRWLLKPLSLIPLRTWQNLTLPCNPISFAMWREAGSTAEAFEAVHASAFPYAFPIQCGLRVARRLAVPFLLTPFLHLGDPDQPDDRTRRQYTSPALRRLLRAADTVFAQTERERDAILDLGVSPERVVVQGLGVEPGECTGGDRAAARAEWGVKPDEVVVGHLANLSREKGTLDLLAAAERVAANGKTCTVVLAGPDMPNFRDFWADYRPPVRVIRTGVLTEAEKRDFFAGLDVFALPSRCDSFGLVLLEAWANSVPNLGYKAGGPGELIRQGVDGLLAPCGDVDMLGRYLERLIDDGELRRRCGEAGRVRALSEFRWGDKLRLVERALTDCEEAAVHARVHRMLAAG